jgi:hypothetical protein
MYIIAAFRSRNSSVKLLEALRLKKIPAQMTNTPKEAYVGCGLSVKFPERRLGQVRTLQARLNLPTFAGYFSVDECGGRTTIKPV